MATAAVAATLIAGARSGQADVGTAPPFAAALAAADGPVVPAAVGAEYRDVTPPRIVGADGSGQRYALSSGTAGVCLIAVRDTGRPGFEVCSPAVGRDVRTQTQLGDGRIKTVVLASGRTVATPLAGARQVAPGLVVATTPGTLPGG